MSPLRVALAWIAAGLFALAAVVCVPIGLEANKLLSTQDDPAVIADRQLGKVFDQSVAADQIEAALAANDSDLARSYVELAQERGIVLKPELTARVAAAVEKANTVAAGAESFARGFITGEPDDVVGLAGTAVGDLFVFGDIRDAVREGTRYVNGQKTDEVVLGLACVGIAITAGTYATFGAAAPVRAGLSVVKAARKTASLSARLAQWIGRALRDVIDWSALRRAGASLSEPTVAVRTAREAVKTEKAGALVQLIGDVGRVQSRAGTQAALDGLKLAQSPEEMGRVAKLAEKKGGKTRAILKTLGRGAIFLSIGAVNLGLWVLGAIATLLGFVASAKSGVERLTQRHIDRRKRFEAERYAAMTALRA